MSHNNRTTSATSVTRASRRLSLAVAACIGTVGATMIAATALAAGTATSTVSPGPSPTIDHPAVEVQPATVHASVDTAAELRAPQRTEHTVPQRAPLVADPQPSSGGPQGCAAGCITSAWTVSSHATPLDVVLHVQTDTPAEVIVAMMALDQGDDPVGGDPYGASHGLVTDWTITLADLLPSTTYEVAVVAIDEDGGTDTETLTFSTGPGALDKFVNSGAGTVPESLEFNQVFVVLQG